MLLYKPFVNCPFFSPPHMLTLEAGILKTGSWAGKNWKNGKVWEEGNITLLNIILMVYLIVFLWTELGFWRTKFNSCPECIFLSIYEFQSCLHPVHWPKRTNIRKYPWSNDSYKQKCQGQWKLQIHTEKTKMQKWVKEKTIKTYFNFLELLI